MHVQKIYKRLQTGAFSNYWHSLNKPSVHLDTESQSANQTIKSTEATDQENAPNHKYPQYMFFADIKIEREKLFSEENCLKEHGREWTQNLYDILANLVQCSLVVKFKNVRINEIKIILHCRTVGKYVQKKNFRKFINFKKSQKLQSIECIF